VLLGCCIVDYCHRAEAQMQFNKYVYIYIYIYTRISIDSELLTLKNVIQCKNTIIHSYIQYTLVIIIRCDLFTIYTIFSKYCT
jgi:hypothetical protein